MIVIAAYAQVPAWDHLTDDQRHRYQGNLDPWAGPVDPQARARYEDRQAFAQYRNEDPCGCWRSDCAECVARVTDGKRPAKGQVRRFTMDTCAP